MNTINGQLFKTMLDSASSNLSNHHKEVDALNVFPVPDGDTGTNMSLTFSSGVNDSKKCLSDSLSEVAKALSKGLLMGARGNSGVILSQIFRGFYQGIEGNSEINVEQLANGFARGSKVAYKAVMRPVEGTILTVIREGSTRALNYVKENPMCTIEEYFEKLISFCHISLDNTPNLLPVLKEVGVVDSGGTGLVIILEGLYAAILGKPITAEEVSHDAASAAALPESDEFGYCTEFILRLSAKGKMTFTENKLKKNLALLGESIVVVQDDDIVKVHVHTLTPGEALTMGQRYGEFVKLKIENMSEQHNTILENSKEEVKEVKPKSKYALITVAAGEGLKKCFEEYRCDVVISGGQTMNPSTEDFVAAIKGLNAEHIFILPNNSNIILAASQAKDVMSDEDITVLPTKTIPQGISACLMFNPEADKEDNIAEMTEAIEHVKTGQITYAIKDTVFEGLEIKEGDYMGINEKDIIVSTPDKLVATCKLLKELITKEDEIVTLIVGEGVNEDEVSVVTGYIEKNFDCEVEVIQGDQPVYSFFIGIE